MARKSNLQMNTGWGKSYNRLELNETVESYPRKDQGPRVWAPDTVKYDIRSHARSNSMNHSGLNAGTRVRCLIPIDLWISMESPFTPNGYVTWLLQSTMVFPTAGVKCTILAYQFWHRLSTPLYSENTSVKITMLSTNEKLWYDVIIIRNGSLAIMNTYLKYTGYAQQWFRRWQWKLLLNSYMHTACCQIAPAKPGKTHFKRKRY